MFRILSFIRFRLLAYFVFFLFFCPYIWAGYVEDNTATLSPEKIQNMERASLELDRKTGIQVATVVIDSLGSQSIQEYAVSFFEKRGIGQKKENNGILFITALKEKKTRIEVGYGLEQLMTDGKSGALLDKYVLPEFKSGSLSKGIYTGHMAIIFLLANEKNVSLNGTLNRTLPMSSSASATPAFIFLIALFVIGFISFKLGINPLWFLLAFMGSNRGSFGSGFGGDGFGGFGGGSSGGGGADRGW